MNFTQQLKKEEEYYVNDKKNLINSCCCHDYPGHFSSVDCNTTPINTCKNLFGILYQHRQYNNNNNNYNNNNNNYNNNNYNKRYNKKMCNCK